MQKDAVDAMDGIFRDKKANRNFEGLTDIVGECTKASILNGPILPKIRISPSQFRASQKLSG